MDAISKKYLQKMLTGYMDNIPKIDKHIEEIKNKLQEAESQKFEMQTAIYDIRETLGVEDDVLNRPV